MVKLILFRFPLAKKLSSVNGHRGAQISLMAMGYDPAKKLTYLFSAAKDKTNIIQWNAQKGEQMVELQGHEANISTLTFGYANILEKEVPILISTDSNGKLVFWNSWVGKVLDSFDKAHKKSITSVVTDQIGKDLHDIAITGSSDGAIGVWDISNSKNLHYFYGHRGTVGTLSCDGKREMVMSGSTDGTARIWSLKDYTCLFIIKGHGLEVSNVFFVQPHFAYTCGFDGKIGVWEINETITDDGIEAVGNCLDFFNGHSSYVDFMVGWKNKIITGSKSDLSVKIHSLLAKVEY